jgi:hypothetical protein
MPSKKLTRRFRIVPSRISIAASASTALLFAIGCATGASGGSSGPSGPTYSGNTHATLLITATNNAQIPIFNFNLEALTLVASDGTSVPVLTTPQTVELGSINGVARPLVAVDVPQGAYTSVKLTYGSSKFAVIDHSSNDGTVDIGNYNINTPANQPATATQQLTIPMVITGSAMGLLLNLNIPKSTTYNPYFTGSPNFAPGAGQTTFSPVYSISAVQPAAQPTTLLDGEVEGVHGQITASSGGVLTITSQNGAVLNFTPSSSTVYAGASGALPIGSFVAINAALQADGSMLATLVQAEGTTQQYNIVGQVVQYTGQLYIQNSGREQQGPNLANDTGFYSENVQLSSSPQFQIAWPNGTIPAGLPFTPALSPVSIVPGQNIATPVTSLQELTGVIPATNVVTLEPQTINGTIAAISTTNGQTSYQVTLFSNDLIGIFGSTQSIVVYVTASTHNITTSPLTTGSIGRFRGLLFNDGGTLRMVASEIEDGVGGS